MQTVKLPSPLLLRAPKAHATAAVLPAGSSRTGVALLAAAVVLFGGSPARADVDFIMASPAAKEGMDRRDEAMKFRCKDGTQRCKQDKLTEGAQRFTEVRGASERHTSSACELFKFASELGKLALVAG